MEDEGKEDEDETKNIRLSYFLGPSGDRKK